MPGELTPVNGLKCVQKVMEEKGGMTSLVSILALLRLVYRVIVQQSTFVQG